MSDGREGCWELRIGVDVEVVVARFRALFFYLSGERE
jgi:hypothetical protein